MTLRYTFMTDIFFSLQQQPHAKVQKNEGKLFLTCGANILADIYEKRTKILHGCPFEC